MRDYSMAFMKQLTLLLLVKPLLSLSNKYIEKLVSSVNFN